jgi:hypothetical protein
MTSFSEAIDRIGEYTESDWWCVYAGKRHVTLRVREDMSWSMEAELWDEARDIGLAVVDGSHCEAHGWVTVEFVRS